MERIRNEANFTNKLPVFGRYFYQISTLYDSFLTIIYQSVNILCISCRFDGVFRLSIFIQLQAQKNRLSFDKRLSIL